MFRLLYHKNISISIGIKEKRQTLVAFFLLVVYMLYEIDKLVKRALRI